MKPVEKLTISERLEDLTIADLLEELDKRVDGSLVVLNLRESGDDPYSFWIHRSARLKLPLAFGMAAFLYNALKKPFELWSSGFMLDTTEVAADTEEE